ncbi:MAG: hypothetical protein WC756_01330, partial [Taibaiella sp.]
MKQVLQRTLFSLLFFAFTIGQGFSQVSITTANFIYLEDFNSYSGNNINTVPQWTIGGTFTYRGPGNGSSNSGGAWAYGIGSERALGYLGSNAASNLSYSISFVNNTGSPITQLEISYDFEQWRFESGNTIGWTVFGTGSLSSTSLAGLNSSSVNVGVTGTVQVTPKSIVLTGLNLLPNSTFGVQLSSGNGAGNDNGIAIDNFRLAVICAPNVVSADTTLCAGESFVLNGNTYTTNQIVSDTLLAANGCDSIVNYNLNFLPAITHSFADTTCFGTTYNWGSQSLTASGSYNQTFTSATNCDSVVTLNLFVRPAITYTFSDTTCFSTTYNWGSQSLTASGSYNQTFTSATNCDSVVTLNLFVRPAITYTFADTTCFSTTYNWGSQNLTASGSYNQTFTSATNCDSVVTLNLFVRPAITYTFADTTCFSTTYNWGTQSLTASGSYNQTFTSVTNCDSIVTLNLFVRPAIIYTFADTTCFGTTYNWGTQSLTASGSYNQTFTSATNCDSIVTLNLFVGSAITYAFADTTCFGTTYNWGPQSLTASGSYNQIFTSATNCDSIVTLNLFVRPAITYTFADTTCFGTTYNWGSQNLTASGSYNQTFTSATNCDSIVTLNLFVRPAITYIFADTTCAGATYSWGSQNLITSGSYSQTFTSATNCDSVVTLNLFARPSNNTTDNQSICSGMSYTFGTQVLTTSGTYSEVFQDINGCDSNVTLTLNVGSAITYAFADTTCAGVTYNWGMQSLTTSGSYNQTFTSTTSCDSIVTLNLFVRPSNNTTDSQSICSGMSYTFGAQVLTTSGSYSEVFQDINGCDSNVTLTLNVGSAITYAFADTTCFGATYNWGSQSLTTTGLYNQTFTSATNCDSIVTLNLFVRPAITYTFADTTCAGVTYNWGSQNLTASGSYNQTFTSATNCDSIVTLNLFVGSVITYAFADTTCFGITYNWGTQSLTASGSYNQTFTSATNCDSIVTLNLFVRPSNNTTDNQSICSGMSYTFGTQVLNTSGTYSEMFQDTNGCDSNVTLTLNVGSAITYAFADTICFGTTYNWGIQNLTTSGSYNQTFTSATNCDSIVTLNFFVRPSNNTTDNQSICSGMSYMFGTQVLTTSGTYSEVFQDINGCDSSVTLTLNVGSAITYTFADTTCFGATYNWGSQILTTTGSYNQTFTSATNCDSIVTLNLFVRPAITYTFADTTCAGVTYNWGSQNLTTSGSYNQTFTSATSCDSIVTLNFFVRPSNNTTDNQSICSGMSYTFGTQELTTSGTYSEVFQDINGCDSNVTLTLTVGSAITYAFADTTCFGTTYNWGMQNLTTSGSYNQTFTSATSCDSIVTLNFFVRPSNNTTDNQSICSGMSYTFGTQVLTTSGTYSEVFQDVNGCDSNVTLTLNVGSAITYTFSDTTCAGATYNWGTQNLTTSGSYNQTFTSATNCDSIVTLNLFV